MTDKEAYLQKMQAKLDEWDANIDALKAKASKANADAQIELNTQIDDLKSERNEMKQKYEELKDAGEDAWKDIRDGAEAAWDRVTLSFKNAKDHFK